MAHPLDTRAEFDEWVSTGGTSAEVDFFTDLLGQYLPGIKVVGSVIKPCLVGINSSGSPYVDFIDDRTVLVVEGQRGVMMADELGRMAASLLTHGTWVDSLPHELLRVRWE